MFYEKKWYNGKVILTECDINICDEHNSDYVPVDIISDVESFTDSSENIPLAQMKAKQLSDFASDRKIAIPEPVNENEIRHEPVYDLDIDPPNTTTCEYYQCKAEVWSSCHRCLILLYFDHFMDNPHCDYHTTYVAKNKIRKITIVNKDLQPEQHQVEGNRKEGGLSQGKKKKREQAKTFKAP
ncbi:hypothetical protein ABEB36_010597 [Hypothenemus hampei]|uniref:Uncharacterized protein n=1 Tax=Hypothenemus hampei TaxID=57062 RepID=A0ABD1ECG1_HYPHA